MFFPFLFLPCYSCSFTYVYAILLLKVVSGAFYFQRKRNFYLFSCFFRIPLFCCYSSTFSLHFLHIPPTTHTCIFFAVKKCKQPATKGLLIPSCVCVRVEKHKVRGISKEHMITVKGFLVVIRGNTNQLYGIERRN